MGSAASLKNGFGQNGKVRTLFGVNLAEQHIEEARRAGIDLDLLDLIQTQSVAERWRHHAAALDLATKLAEGKQRRDAGLQRTAAPSE